MFVSNVSVLSNAYIGLNLSVLSNIYAGNEIRASGDVIAFYNASDFRLKKEIQELDYNMLETVVMKLRPVEFTWKEDIHYAPRRNTRDVGFIAQEMHEIIPLTEMSLGDIEGVEGGPVKGIRHERIIPYLVKAIQELNEKVDSLQQQLQERNM